MSKILIAGAGAIGMWLGALLADAGHEVTLLARAPHCDAIQEHGLRTEGHTNLAVKVGCTTAPPPGPFDGIIITAKAHATAGLAAAVAPSLARDGVMASMQNGLGNEAILRDFHASPAIALTSHGVTVLGPGHVRHAGLGATSVGPATGADAGPARTLHGWLGDAGLAPEWHDDMRTPIWAKVVVNAAINPVCALAGATNGLLLQGPPREEARRLAEEAARVARAEGASIDDAWSVVAHVIEQTADNKCSMLQDIEAGRPTEIEQITGAIVAAAKRHGIEVPANQAILARFQAQGLR